MTDTKNRTISVWLSLEDGPNKGKFILQKRSDNEKTFPFFCQATWSGGVEEKEDVFDAVKRECLEELGKDFYDNFDFTKLIFFAKSSFFRKSKDSVWECNHYTGFIKEEVFKKAVLHKGAAPKFLSISQNDDFCSANSGKDPIKNIVLFDDQYKILKEIIKQ